MIQGEIQGGRSLDPSLSVRYLLRDFFDELNSLAGQFEECALTASQATNRVCRASSSKDIRRPLACEGLPDVVVRLELRPQRRSRCRRAS